MAYTITDHLNTLTTKQLNSCLAFALGNEKVELNLTREHIYKMTETMHFLTLVAFYNESLDY